mmetsp:Transcript_18500/g.38392  ORF Transcript_18500/g.38392 Transcript_18500/m.38392 type:complete len:87 (-) Transcript_18500:125-385(-)
MLSPRSTIVIFPQFARQELFGAVFKVGSGIVLVKAYKYQYSWSDGRYLGIFDCDGSGFDTLHDEPHRCGGGCLQAKSRGEEKVSNG